MVGDSWTCLVRRGRITRVEVSTDGGRNWSDAALGADLRQVYVRFRHLFDWNGRDTVILSRATDETVMYSRRSSSFGKRAARERLITKTISVLGKLHERAR